MTARTLYKVLEAVQGVEPDRPTAISPRVPPDLETICPKCLCKEPADRYPTAAGLADDLRRHREGRPITARPVGPVERAVKFARRQPWVAG